MAGSHLWPGTDREGLPSRRPLSTPTMSSVVGSVSPCHRQANWIVHCVSIDTRRYPLSSLLRPGRGAEYCHQPIFVSVCLSVREHISGTALPIGTKLCTQIPCGRGSVVLRRHCAALCISGFMDDVTFGRNGPYVVAWPAWSATSRGGVWCLWMLVITWMNSDACFSYGKVWIWFSIYSHLWNHTVSSLIVKYNSFGWHYCS